MLSRSNSVKTSFILSVASLSIAFVSVALSQQLYYLNYLLLFNVMALLMIALAIAALLFGLVSIWRSYHSFSTWLATALAMFVLSVYLFS